MSFRVSLCIDNDLCLRIIEENKMLTKLTKKNEKGFTLHTLLQVRVAP